MPYFKDNKLLLIHIPKTGGTSVEKYFSQKYNKKIGIENLYFSYYENTINNEITKYRKAWKQILYNKKKINEKNNTSIKKALSFSSIDSLDSINRDSIYEFRLFKKIRLSKELQHSLQHLTWIEMQRHKDILWCDVESQDIISDNPYDRNEYEVLTIVRNPYDRIISELLFRGIINKDSILRPKAVYLKLKKYLEKDDNIFDNHKLPQYMFVLNEMGNIIENLTILHTETLNEDMKRLGYSDFNHHFQVSKCKISSGVTKYSNVLNKNAIEIINKYYKRDFELFGYTML